MKRIFTLVLAVACVVAVSAQKIKVGYYGLNKTNMAVTAPITADPLLVLLEADPNFEVTRKILTTVDNTVVVDYALYDIIIVQESFGGANGILTPSGGLSIGKIEKPFMYNKSYALQATRAFASAVPGAGVEALSFYLKVDPANQSHDLFKGISFTDNSVALFKKFASDAGATTDNPYSGTGTNSSKSINYNKNTVLSNTNTLLGYPRDLFASADVPVICVNDIPVGTVVGDQTLKARMIAIGLNFGAMCGDNGTNMTTEGLTLIRNAAYLLAGLTVPSTPASLPTTGLKRTASSVNAVAQNGAIRVNVASPANVNVYSVDGKLVSSANVASSQLVPVKKGMYIVKVEGVGTTKVVVTK